MTTPEAGPAPAPLPAAPRDWGRLALSYGPPAAAFLLAWALFTAVVLGNGYAFSAQNFSKWDATLYQSIAQKGYEFFPCAGQSMWGGQSWCGNTGWFPLYAWLTKLLAIFVRDLPLAAVLVTAASFYAVLWLVWNWLLERRPTAENALLLLLAAFFPGSLYYLVPYPIPLYLLLILLTFKFLLAERYLWAGAIGALASLCYSSAPALVITLTVYLLIVHRGWPLRRQLPPLLLTCGLTAAGYLLFLVFLQLDVGHWDANLKVLGKYGVGLYDPLATFMEKTVAMFRGEYRGREEWQGLHHLLCSALMLTFLVTTTRDKTRPPTPLETLCLTQGVTFWVFPLALGSSVLLWRAQALLLPTIVLFKRLSRATQAILLVVCVLLAGEQALQYLKNWLP